MPKALSAGSPAILYDWPDSHRRQTMIDPKTVIEGIGAVAKLKGLFHHDAESGKAQPKESTQDLADVQVLGLGLTTEQLAMLSITVVACVAIIAIAVVASQRGMLQV